MLEKPETSAGTAMTGEASVGLITKLSAVLAEHDSVQDLLNIGTMLLLHLPKEP